MAYWIFQTSPRRYNLQKQLDEGIPEMSWKTSQHREEISAGDTAFVWQSGTSRGLRAVVRVETDPEEIDQLPHERNYCLDGTIDTRSWRVLTTIQRHFEVIPRDEVAQIPGLQSLTVLRRFPQGTNFPVTPEQARILEGLMVTKRG